VDKGIPIALGWAGLWQFMCVHVLDENFATDPGRYVMANVLGEICETIGYTNVGNCGADLYLVLAPEL